MDSLRIWGLPDMAGLQWVPRQCSRGPRGARRNPPPEQKLPRLRCPCHQRGGRFQQFCYLNTFEVLEQTPVGGTSSGWNSSTRTLAVGRWWGLLLAHFCALPEVSPCATPTYFGGVCTLLMPVGLNQEMEEALLVLLLYMTLWAIGEEYQFNWNTRECLSQSECMLITSHKASESLH